MSTQSLSKLLTPEETAQLLGVAKQTLAIWRCEKRQPLPYIKCGGRVRYRPADVEAFLQRSTHLAA